MNFAIRRVTSASGVVLMAVLALPAMAADKTLSCTEDPLFQQQDFTLGEWQVFDAGKPVATVKLEKILKGCGIQETWTTTSKDEPNGTGLFTYSRLLKSWGYFWVADVGQATAFTGAQVNKGKMMYVTKAPQPTGKEKLRHWTLTLQPDGSIEELSVGTLDGTEWASEYVLVWRRKT